MTKILRPEEQNMKNCFWIRKELNYTAIKDIKSRFRLEKETKAIKDRIIRDINNLLSMKKIKIIINQ